MSSAKFWQMIGRGTRLCEGVLDGDDKREFFVFDFCSVCDFFKANKGRETTNTVTLQSALFNLKAQIAFKLQGLEYQTTELIAFRQRLVVELLEKVNELDRNNFAVKLELRFVEKYAKPEAYETLSYEDTLLMAEHVAPLVLPEADEINALRFDALMYGIELAYLVGKTYNRARNDLKKKVSALAGIANIPQIMIQSALINDILQTDYLDMAGINEFEHIRERLRDLIKYIPKKKIRYTTDFTDDILSVEWEDSSLDNDVLKNYKAKAEHYIRQHQQETAIAKLKENEWKIEEYTERKLKGTITAKENQIMLFTMPTEPGWTIKVDGKKVETFEVLKAFIGINLAPGEHTVEASYTPPGFVVGVITLILGIAVCVFIWLYDRRTIRFLLKEQDAESLVFHSTLK
jgi:type I restriction enzyme R subunit